VAEQVMVDVPALKVNPVVFVKSIGVDAAQTTDELPKIILFASAPLVIS
jgi:hypothetical protein